MSKQIVQTVRMNCLNATLSWKLSMTLSFNSPVRIRSKIWIQMSVKFSNVWMLVNFRCTQEMIYLHLIIIIRKSLDPNSALICYLHLLQIKAVYVLSHYLILKTLSELWNWNWWEARWSWSIWLSRGQLDTNSWVESSGTVSRVYALYFCLPLVFIIFMSLQSSAFSFSERENYVQRKVQA